MDSHSSSAASSHCCTNNTKASSTRSSKASVCRSYSELRWLPHRNVKVEGGVLRLATGERLSRRRTASGHGRRGGVELSVDANRSVEIVVGEVEEVIDAETGFGGGRKSPVEVGRRSGSSTSGRSKRRDNRCCGRITSSGSEFHSHPKIHPRCHLPLRNHRQREGEQRRTMVLGALNLVLFLVGGGGGGGGYREGERKKGEEMAMGLGSIWHSLTCNSATNNGAGHDEANDK